MQWGLDRFFIGPAPLQPTVERRQRNAGGFAHRVHGPLMTERVWSASCSDQPGQAVVERATRDAGSLAQVVCSSLPYAFAEPVLRGRRRERLLHSPAPLKSRRQRAGAETELLGPRRERLALALVGDPVRASRVAVLLRRRRPSAVVRSVALVDVVALNRVLGGRSRTDVLREVRERQPASRYLNAAAPVVLERGVRRDVEAGNQTEPNRADGQWVGHTTVIFALTDDKVNQN